MPGRPRPGLMTRSQSIPNNSHSPSPSDALAAFLGGDAVLYTRFTDDEDENNPPTYFHNVSNPEPLSPTLDEDVLTRTGEASRIRRRGARHGRRHQYTYTSLSCGVDQPWRFKFEGHNDGNGLGKLNSKPLPSTTSHRVKGGSLSLEFPSTGCHAVLTDRAFISSHQGVYSAIGLVDSVVPVEKIYLDEEQKRTANQVLADAPGCKDWNPVACCQCGNVVGIRYPQIFLDRNEDPLEPPHGPLTISRFAFFFSTVTSSKLSGFQERKYHLEPSTGRPLRSRPVSIPVSGPLSRNRRNMDAQISEVSYQESPPADPQDWEDTIPVRLPLSARNESSTHPSSLQPLSSESILPSIPESSSDTIGNVQEQDNAGESWASWMPNPYMYATESEDGETMQRELEQRRLPLSEAISILQTTREEFMPNLQDTDEEVSEETEPRLILADIIVLSAEDTHQSSTPASDEPIQESNPYPYTHLSASAPVPRSVATRTREVERPDQQHITDYYNYSLSLDSETNDGTSHLMLGSQETRNDFSLSLALTQSNDTRSSHHTLPLPTHLPISYDSPAFVADIEANNRDTGEVENIGILVEVAAPPQNLTSSFGSAVVVPSLVDSSQNPEQRTMECIHPTFLSNSFPPISNEGANDDDNSGSSFSSVQEQEEPYSTTDEQDNDSDSKPDNLFNNNVTSRELPNHLSQADDFDLQSTNMNTFREYTPSLPPLSPGALATPSLPYSPTTSVPLPPTLLPLMEILDSIEMEVLPLARYSDLEDSGSESESSDEGSNAESQNIRDESVYTTELPWDCYDPDPPWLDYSDPPSVSPFMWQRESRNVAADENETLEPRNDDELRAVQRIS